MTARSPFVGRRTERSELARLVALTADGGGGLAVVLGEPGIGKTALVAAAVGAGGPPAIWARARQEPGAPGLWLWRQVLRGLRERGWPDDPVRGSAGNATISAAGAETAGASSVGGHDRFARFDALAHRLTAAARRAPYVVALDDLHWADAESLAFLDFLAPDLAAVPLVVLATTRDRDALTAGADLVVSLAGLSPDELSELLGALADGPADPELVSVVARYTGGNPFLVTEVTRLLRGSGSATDPARWQGVTTAGARAVLVRRLEPLPAPTRRVLAVAAVGGLEVDVELTAAVLGTDPTQALDMLRPAIQAALVHEVDLAQTHAGLRFAHDLVRETIVAELDPVDRRRIHRQLAAVLAAGDGRNAAAVAGHLRAAGDRGGAAHWSQAAGDVAFRAGMYAEAAVWFDRAVQDTPHPPAAVRVCLAEALSRCGRVGEADRIFLAAAAQARAEGDVRTVAEAVLGLGTVGGAFEVRLLEPYQLAMLGEALNGLGEADDAVRSQLMARLSVSSTLQADPSARAELADAAVAMARRLGDDGALAYALGSWCDAHAGPADVEPRLAAATEMLTAARWAGDPELELLAHRLLLVAHLERGDVAAATHAVTQFALLADSLRQPQFCWYARLVEGMLALLHGDLDRAEELARRSAELGRRAGSANARMLADGALLPMIDRERGGHGWAALIEEMNRDHAEGARGLDSLPLFTIGYGASREAVRRSLDQLAARPVSRHDSLYLLATSLVGAGAAYVADQDLMSESYQALLPYAHLMVLDGTAAVCHGPVSATLARIAAARGDPADAERWYREAARCLWGVRAPLLLGRLDRERRQWSAGAGSGRVETAAGPGADQGPADDALVREGDVWLVRFEGRSARLRHGKGMADLARLLSSPGREFHVLDLVALAEGRAPGPAPPAGADLGPALDPRARTAYRRRLHELAEEIDQAQERRDDDRAGDLQQERSALLAELARAYGLSGRARPQGSDAERARKAVGMRLRQAVTRISEPLPQLGRHLRHSLVTGTYCSYRPEHPRTWHCQP